MFFDGYQLRTGSCTAGMRPDKVQPGWACIFEKSSVACRVICEPGGAVAETSAYASLRRGWQSVIRAVFKVRRAIMSSRTKTVIIILFIFFIMFLIFPRGCPEQGGANPVGSQPSLTGF